MPTLFDLLRLGLEYVPEVAAVARQTRQENRDHTAFRMLSDIKIIITGLNRLSAELRKK